MYTARLPMARLAQIDRLDHFSPRSRPRSCGAKHMLNSDYLSDIPNMHTWDDGKTWNTGGFDAAHLSKLLDFLKENRCRHIIETGAGNSTITFLLHGAERVVSIAPEEDLFDRISSYCVANSIDRSALQAVVGFSQWALPEIARNHTSEFDFALIDGHHGWPLVFVDFCYMNHAVRQGGFIMVDDVDLHSVRELVNLLNEQPGYESCLDLGKALIFQKTTDASALPEWNEQPYIVRSSANTAVQTQREHPLRSMRRRLRLHWPR